ncbi:hypothetical protein A3A50_03140 [Candidatus Woesebacteria bacterium RIFCSPLOWO2_01_FULL_38_20]|nr:MAG: hypothetical protein A3A50_03140 [Candidatus Woesebacteria bacterium RIFCSPLOWO2_01_FULL_38_20]
MKWVLPKLFNSAFIDIRIVLISLMIGFISHLLADSLTKEGLPLFFPFSFKLGMPPISALRITTGSWAENFIVFPGVLVYLVWFVGNNKDQLINVIRLIKN